jgi:hypothetical protein
VSKNVTPKCFYSVRARQHKTTATFAATDRLNLSKFRRQCPKRTAISLVAYPVQISLFAAMRVKYGCRYHSRHCIQSDRSLGETDIAPALPICDD